eukprot:tig00000851_g4886.t1
MEAFITAAPAVARAGPSDLRATSQRASSSPAVCPASARIGRKSVFGAQIQTAARFASTPGAEPRTFTVEAISVEQRGKISRSRDFHTPADITRDYDPEDPHPAFTQVINELYPEAVPSKDFLRQTQKALLKLGFSKINTLPCVTMCRDEICRPLAIETEDLWCRDEYDGKFVLTSLAGIMSSGRTAVKAAVSHAPMMDGFERYVFMSFPHIAIDYRGRVGSVARVGRREKSHACGALIGLEEAFAAGKLRTRPELDEGDLEMSNLMQQFFDIMPPGYHPTLVEVTDTALRLAEETLDRVVPEVVYNRRCHYAVVTGIQIHGPDGTNYIWPSKMYAIVHGVRHEVEVDFTPYRVTRADAANETLPGEGMSKALEAAAQAFEAASMALKAAAADVVEDEPVRVVKKKTAARVSKPRSSSGKKKTAVPAGGRPLTQFGEPVQPEYRGPGGAYSPPPDYYSPAPSPAPTPAPYSYSGNGQSSQNVEYVRDWTTGQMVPRRN